MEASPKERLLEAVVGVALNTGISDQSLRAIAEAAGTSHRMLIHHFGSREGLLVEVIKAVEARERAIFTALGDQADRNVLDSGWAFWEQLRDPKLASQERLFFEVYGQALQGRAWATPLLEGVVDDWIGPFSESLIAAGSNQETAQIDARLCVAVARGLLLDVLATADDEAVDAAMERFVELLRGALLPGD
jgi:AcrR family transcriptional regulator